MSETIRCPECNAEIAQPASARCAVQCPRCQCVFAWSNPAAADDAPRPDQDDHELRIRIAPKGELCSAWPGIAAQASLAVSIGAFAVAAVHTAVVGDFVHHAEFLFLWLTLTSVPAFIALVAWCYFAYRNACMIAQGLVHTPLGMLWPLCIPAVNIHHGYEILQELWRASEPLAVRHRHAWQDGPPSWLVRLCFLNIIAAVGFAFLALLVSLREPGTGDVILIFGYFNMMAAGVLLIVIIRQITQRQQERYRRLYEDPA